jgi:lipopolysaccharide/colanic/teichoic acid biosynthesis glycosyltransferase
MVAQRTLEVEEEWSPADLLMVVPALETAPAAAASPGGIYRRFGKRLLDLVLGIPLLLLAVPLVLVLALLVLATSGWPAFYVARRAGRHAKEFSMLKLRTMVRDADLALLLWQAEHPDLAAEYAANFKVRHDPRITPLGRILRRLSLDELPQLWNVVRGEMSLVGPRPYYLRELEPHPQVMASILSVRPGLTGPWQVDGRNALHPRLRMRLDQLYGQDHSLADDLLYLVRTLKPLLRPNGY